MTEFDAGKVDVRHLCKLAGVSRASYYRRFDARAPRDAVIELAGHIQLLSLRYKFYGYRRITAVLRRSGMVINAKRVQRLMREDNLIAMPIWMPRWPWRRWIARSPVASPSLPASFIIPIVACNMPRPNTGSALPITISQSA
jgi:hypothetical protein